MSTSTTAPSFSDVAEFVRAFAGLGRTRIIAPQTFLDADLGITGDDGSDLLLEAAEHFSSRLLGADGYTTTFSLAQNECLFGSEGLDLLGIGALAYRLSGQPKNVVRDLTVGELHNAICRHRLATGSAA